MQKLQFNPKKCLIIAYWKLFQPFDSLKWTGPTFTLLNRVYWFKMNNAIKLKTPDSPSMHCMVGPKQILTSLRSYIFFSVFLQQRSCKQKILPKIKLVALSLNMYLWDCRR